MFKIVTLKPNFCNLEFIFLFVWQDNEEQSYSTLKTRNTSALVSGLKPGTKYIFQVRARTSAGCGRFSQNVEIQTGKAGDRNSAAGLAWHWEPFLTFFKIQFPYAVWKNTCWSLMQTVFRSSWEWGVNSVVRYISTATLNLLLSFGAIL